MPNFTARIVSGATPAVWIDPAATLPTGLPPPNDFHTVPSRQNENPQRSPIYLKVAPGATVVLAATVGGVEAPLDAALGGRLFLAGWTQWSGAWPLPIAPSAAQSSRATIVVPAGSSHLGHFIFSFWRDNGGSILIPFDVEA